MLTALPDDQVLAPAGPVRRARPRSAQLAAAISTIWVTTAPPGNARLRVLPDAAVDLVLSGSRLVVAGPDTHACIESLVPGVVIGMQIRPSAVPALLGHPASATCDERIPIEDIWGPAGRVLVERLAGAPDVPAAMALVEEACQVRLSNAESRLEGADLRELLTTGRGLDARELGLSERQLRRRCVAMYGYGPRTLRRIVRFQCALSALRSQPAMPLAEVAARTGYVDQSHLAHDVGTFSGLTPLALRRAG